MSKQCISKKLLIILISFCWIQLLEASPKASDKLDITEVANNPIEQMQYWINSSNEPKLLEIATIWQGQPALRLTAFEKVVPEGLLFSTSPSFNMVKHFQENQHVATSMVFNTPLGRRQIRIQGEITHASNIKSLHGDYHDKNDKFIAKSTVYQISPSWVQFSEFRKNGDKVIYTDMDYTLSKGKWVISDKIREIHMSHCKCLG